MRYMLLLWGDEAAEAALSDAERRAIVGEHMQFVAELREDGQLVDSDPLEPSSTAAVVRQDGSVSDGPFIETKEQLGGYYTVECADRDEAIALARRMPASPGLVVEVRPLAAM